MKEDKKMNTPLPDSFLSTPIVYAAGNEYQIFLPVSTPTLMWVKVGDREFYDDSNGVLRSDVTMHRIAVPMEILDKEKKYTVCIRQVLERKAYHSVVGEIETYTSDFKPVCGDTLHIYHVADAHNAVEGPVNAATYFGDELDLLILNGDIPEHCGKAENLDTIYKIASQVTKGRIPVIFSRGNHDTRGAFAEKLESCTPLVNGNSYYSVRLGSLWLLILDCAEDKVDENEEYGHTVCCEAFRRRETAYIEDVIRRAEKYGEEYAAPGIKHKIIVAHNPFTRNSPNPKFNIEVELYTYWSKLLREHIMPELMLCGHLHRTFVSPVGSKHDSKGQPCTVVVASEINKEDKSFAVGGAITISDSDINVKFTDNLHNVKGEETISLKA